ncbi:uncharacterized protein [Diabrotica undecimpunctata]|uniref:uncharacterized protein n=1 Tax=Diabrotica undecimpunctata TaxID=50387 RepID=UPI003B63BEE5
MCSKCAFCSSTERIRAFKIRSRNFDVTSSLSPLELEKAMDALVLVSPKEIFEADMMTLETGKPWKKSLLNLNPFMEKAGCLRVGGRLNLTNLPYSQKHPRLLRAKHRFTILLFEMEYNRLLHCGPQQLLSTIRENFWVLGGRNIARKVYRNCVRCFRCKPIPLEQIMEVLPKERVEVNPPFYVTGMDYAGPFPMKTKRGRGSQIIKCYIYLFVCVLTKALYLRWYQT